MTPTNPDPVAAAIEALERARDWIDAHHFDEEASTPEIEEIYQRQVKETVAQADAALASLRSLAHAKGESVGTRIDALNVAIDTIASAHLPDCPAGIDELSAAENHISYLRRIAHDAALADEHAVAPESPSPSQTPDLGREAVIEECAIRAVDIAAKYGSPKLTQALLDGIRALSATPGEPK